MKRILQRTRDGIASLCTAGTVLLMLLATDARATNYCNNAVPPCNPDDPASECYRPSDPAPACEPKECGKCTKSPCYVGSGVYSREEHDLAIRTTGFPIEVSRAYLSSHSIDGDLGRGWTSSLSARIYYTSRKKASPNSLLGDDMEAHVRLSSGALYRFTQNLDGSFTPPAGRFDTLVRNPDNSWDLQPQRTRSRLHFSPTGNLEQMVDDYGNTQTWTYIDDRLQSITDSTGSGRSIDVTWGANGRISDVTDMTGRNVHYEYSSTGVLMSVTNPLGQITTHRYAQGRFAPLLSSIDDHWGRNITTIVHDTKDRVTSYTEAGETYTYSYASGITSKSDSSGNTWRYPYVAGGLVTESQPPAGGAAELTTYDANGLVLTSTDPVGVKTRNVYNARGHAVTIVNDDQGATAVEWRMTYDPAFPDAMTSAIPYDPATGQIHRHWQGSRWEFYQAGSAAPGALHRSYKLNDDGTTARLQATFTYDTQGRLLTHTSASGALTTYTYDTFGNLEKIESASNNDAGIRPVTTYQYDALGRMTSSTDPLGFVTTLTWDELDRVTSRTLPKPSPSSSLTFRSTFHYDEFDSTSQLLFIREVDANDRATRSGYDAFDQLLAVVDQAGNVTRNTYTKGLFTAQTDANGNVITYEYDARRRLSKVSFPNGTFEQLTYHPDGTVASKRDRAAQTVTFAYDRHKRLRSRTYPNGGAITQTFLGEKLTAVLDTSTSPSETHSYVYDSSFRLTSNTQGARGTLHFTYDAGDRLATVAHGGSTETYGYYPDDSLRTIDWSAVSGSFRYDYTRAGQVASVTFPNNQTRTFTYDQQGRMTNVHNAHPVAGVLASFSYGYDVDPFSGTSNMLGYRTSVTATAPTLGLSNARTNLGYDQRYQLVRADYPAAAPYNGTSAQWTYDAAGNRITATSNAITATYVYNKFASNRFNSTQLQSDGANAYTYDAEGNVATRNGSRGNFAFAWNYDNRLRAVSGDVTASYQYDFNGRRATKTVGGASTSYLFASDHPVAESGATSAQYLYGFGFDQPLAMARNGQLFYYAIDGTDSVVTLNDANGAVHNSYAWDAWGSALASTQAVVNPLGYTARDTAEAGMNYYRARYYEPASGRFSSEDPLQELVPIAGGEIYGYVRNSPLMYSDPTGLRQCSKTSQLGEWHLVSENPVGKAEWMLEKEIERRVTITECLWIKMQTFAYHYEKTMTIKHSCTCPTMVYYTAHTMKYTEHKNKRVDQEKLMSVILPCSFSPPKR